jgi:hypothetical protein
LKIWLQAVDKSNRFATSRGTDSRQARAVDGGTNGLTVTTNRALDLCLVLLSKIAD